jgi:hypothetical protein
MRKLLGHLIWGVTLGVLFASVGAGEAKAGPNYGISITIVDNTHPATSPFTLLWTSPNNTANPSNPNLIVASAGFSTAASGVSITGLQAQSTSTNLNASLQTQATATVQDASTDSYTVTITTFNNGYTQPVGTAGVIGESESGTYTYAPGGNVLFQGWYNSTNPTTPTTSGPTPGVQTIPITSTATTGNSSSSTLATANFAPFIQPYALTSTLTINITGNGNSGSNSTAAVQGTVTVTAVPEPASLVMFLTGMPMPLMVLGMLRRRKAQRVA